MRESEIDGPFDFSEATPYYDLDSKPSEAWIDARDCIVNGQITGSGARLAGPQPRPVAEVKPSDRRYALWLANADVRGSIFLLNNFVAEGGVCVRSARIRGDIWATGAKITKGEGYALNAQAARIGDLVALNDGFTADGTVWLLATQIGARLLLNGAKLSATRDKDSAEARGDRIVLYASNVQVGASVFMGKDFKAKGQVNFSGATIRGSFRCERSTFSTPDGRARAFVANGVEISNEALFDGAVIEGRMNLNGAKVGGRVSFNGAEITNETTDGRGIALSMIGARIGGVLRFEELGAQVFRSRGLIRFDGTEVGGDLIFRGCSLRNSPDADEDSGIALSAKRVRIGGNVEFDRFSAEGATMLSGATAGRRVRISGKFSNRRQSAICAKDMRIGGDLRFEKTVAEGDLQLERIDITGSLVWDGLEVSRKRDESHSPLNLRHGRIGSVLNAKDLTFDPPSSIDLCGMRIGAIEHAWPKGWGSPPPEQDKFGLTVNFDGLIYERIRLDSADPPGSTLARTPPEHLISRIFGRLRSPLSDKHSRWLELQKKPPRRGGPADERDFFPQPYRQLARVLRNQGEESAARDIAIAEQWAAPKRGLRKIARWVFGIGFGFGLRPRNAMATLLVFLLLGTVGVRMAKNRDMLMESLVVASTGAEILPSGEKDDGKRTHLKRAVLRFDGSKGGPPTEVDCTDAANTWTDDLVYAADMLVPFIPLHQEGKCEIVPSADWGPGVWRCLKAIYEVTGWIIFSLALVTFSGVLKRFDRDVA